jgi:hypothetical protein
MSPVPPVSSQHEPERGLPVVVPPSGRFIAQLFLVPFAIVASVVGILLLVQWLVGSARSPADFLSRLDNPNPDVRWRGAEDLAQVLRRDDQLASDPRFGLDLVDRLERAIHDAASEEKEPVTRRLASREKRLPDAEEQEPARGYLFYLTGGVGNLSLPLGAPLLGNMALTTKGNDSAAVALGRRRALWVLAQLGDNLKRFDRLSESRRKAVLDELQGLAASSTGSRREWASTTLDYHQGPEAKSLHVLGLDDVFAKCAQDQDPLLRSLVAFALNFWEGLPSENARMEELLVKLSRDDGHGEEMLARLREADPQPNESITRRPGSTIRINANIALARRGSPRVRLDLLKEMLDESALREDFRVKTKKGDIPDEDMVGNTLDATLRAILELHERRPEMNLSSLQDPIDKLAGSSNMALRGAAKHALEVLGFH